MIGKLFQGIEADFECTWWLDGLPTWLGGKGNEWVHCCIGHDLVEKSREGDEVLRQCVSNSEALLFNAINISPFMAEVMHAGLGTFGVVFVLLTSGVSGLKHYRKTNS